MKQSLFKTGCMIAFGIMIAGCGNDNTIDENEVNDSEIEETEQSAMESNETREPETNDDSETDENHDEDHDHDHSDDNHDHDHEDNHSDHSNDSSAENAAPAEISGLEEQYQTGDMVTLSASMDEEADGHWHWYERISEDGEWIAIEDEYEDTIEFEALENIYIKASFYNHDHNVVAESDAVQVMVEE